MSLVSVAPIQKGPLKETLSYFTKKPLPPGALAKISLRGNDLLGLVLSCEDALSHKSSIKRASFSLKKIETAKEGVFFSAPFLEAGKRAARWHALPLGTFLSHVFPTELYEKWDGATSPLAPKSTHRLYEEFVLQAPKNERVAIYRALIREQFAKKQSVFLRISRVRPTF